MQHVYLMLEWWKPVRGSDVVVAALAGNPHAVVETVHPLSGMDFIPDGDGEGEVHFTTGVVDGGDALHLLCDEIRRRGVRVKFGSYIPAELARSSFTSVMRYIDDET